MTLTSLASYHMNCRSTKLDNDAAIKGYHVSVQCPLPQWAPGAVARSDARPPAVQTVAVRSTRPATFFHGDWS